MLEKKEVSNLRKAEVTNTEISLEDISEWESGARKSVEEMIKFGDQTAAADLQSDLDALSRIKKEAVMVKTDKLMAG
jgi:hypothetical protein